MLPHSDFIARQQARSAGVIGEPGNAHIIVGARSDTQATKPTPIRESACIQLLGYVGHGKERNCRSASHARSPLRSTTVGKYLDEKRATVQSPQR